MKRIEYDLTCGWIIDVSNVFKLSHANATKQFGHKKRPPFQKPCHSIAILFCNLARYKDIKADPAVNR